MNDAKAIADAPTPARSTDAGITAFRSRTQRVTHPRRRRRESAVAQPLQLHILAADILPGVQQPEQHPRLALDETSAVTGDCHAAICGSPEVKPSGPPGRFGREIWARPGQLGDCSATPHARMICPAQPWPVRAQERWTGFARAPAAWPRRSPRSSSRCSRGHLRVVAVHRVRRCTDRQAGHQRRCRRRHRCQRRDSRCERDRGPPP